MNAVATAARVNVSPITPAVGAVVDGVDLKLPLDPDTVALLRQAWLERGVLLFRGQHLGEAQLEAFVAQFGTPITEPSNPSFGAPADAPPVHSGDTGMTKAVAERWHADATWLEAPPMATALAMVDLPAVGGDTCWANAADAYDALIAPIRAMLDQLTAMHWMLPSLEAMSVRAQNDDVEFVHPLVRIHPETGRKVLNVSEGWTRCIMELPPAQSMHLLALIYDHIKQPQYTMRWRWSPGDLALWDNRTVQHYAVPDYEGGRFIHRCVLQGERPYGPEQARRL